MYRRYTRAFEARERLQLQHWRTELDPARHRWPWSLVGKILLAGTALTLSAYTLELESVAGLMAGLAMMGALHVIIRSRRQKLFRAVLVERIEAALKLGQVDVEHVIATRVATLTHAQHDLVSYFFEVEPGRLFFFTGDFAPEEIHGPFPSSDFQIVTTSLYDLPVGLFSDGHPLNPLRTLTSDDLPGAHFPEAGLFDAHLDSLVEYLTQAI